MTRVFLNSVKINNLNKVDFINLLIVICLYLHFNTTTRMISILPREERFRQILPARRTVLKHYSFFPVST